MIAQITTVAVEVAVEVAGERRGVGPTNPVGTVDCGGWSLGYA